MQSGAVEDAIAMLRSLEGPTSDPHVEYLLGLAYYRKGEYAHAVESLSAGVGALSADDPDYRDAIHLRGLSNYYLGHVREAIPDLERVLEWSPENTELTYALGVAYIQTLNTEKARVVFARVFGVPSDSAAAHLVLAQVMIHHGAENLAEKELQQALALDAKLPQANQLLGEMAIFRADIDAGIALLQKEIALNPANGMAYYRLGEAYSRQQKWDEAIPPLQRSIWLNPYFSGPFIVLGKVYMKKGNLSNAADVLQRAIAMDPNNASAHYILGQVLQQADRPEDAKKEFDAASRLQGSGAGSP